MTHLQKLRIQSILRWVSLDFIESCLSPSRTRVWVSGSFHNVQSLRFYSRKTYALSKDSSDSEETLTGNRKIAARISRFAKAEAQSALLEYLHCTRSMQFLDAEHMSRNAPIFLNKLLRRVENETEIRCAIARFLNFHPINEFEPFFESMGLKPAEYSPLLPRDLMFLNDDVMLLENYHVLCNFGVDRMSMGKIYKEATEVFRYDFGVLELKLQAFKEIGLAWTAITKLISLSPHLLIGSNHRDCCKVLEKMKSIGIEYDRIESHIMEGNVYNWSRILELLCLLSNIGFSEEQLEKFICHHLALVFESSGSTTLSLIVLVLKFGITRTEICSMFMQFPPVQVRKFVCNLRQSYHFLVDIDMEVKEIGKIVCSHPVLLGSVSLKKANTLLECLNAGKKRVCNTIKENPEILKGWGLGSKVKPLPSLDEDAKSRMLKTKFLLGLGFAENSNEMKRAQKVFRGKGGELQERFDCFVKAGLTREVVSMMVKLAPQVLNQSKDLIETKIDYLVNVLGYPLSSLVAYPGYISYTIERIKLRLLMYNWLRDHRLAKPDMALSTILATAEAVFVKDYVNRHPKGPRVWEKLKKQVYPQ
ncbi:transcription termination factor MTEF18, mitochondrial-like [Diospyros lotus]|uniref:transcription termination factor MTEF18, mitochondrial-like n=1 Tax=Diospyros lotus TaxID=55363 RepID=UPI00225B285C|nr:transcription termination factor MTEF18, mitochondrial-like [Diospyros lotus]